MMLVTAIVEPSALDEVGSGPERRAVPRSPRADR
jgi:hypothetical protein